MSDTKGEAKRQKTPRSPIFQELVRLNADLGLGRKDLLPALGQDLRQAWGITAATRPADVRQIVLREVEALLDTIGDPKVKEVLSVYFNVPGALDGQVATLLLGKRLERLEEVKFVPQTAANTIRIEAFGRFESIIEGRLRHSEPPPPERSTFILNFRPKIAVSVSASTLALIAALVFAFRHDSSPPTPKPSPSVSTSSPVPPVLASFVQYPPPVPDYNNAWVLPQVLPASEAAHFSSLGLTTATWAPQMGGHLVVDGNYRVTLTGEAADGLTITNIMAVVVKRAAPLTGTFIDIGGQDMNSNQQFMFKLDQSPAEALYGDPTNQAYGQPVFAGNNISLAKAESMTISVEAQAQKADYQFNLQFTVVVDGKEQNITVSGINGKPFEVTGLATSYPILFTHSSDFKSIVSLGQITDCSKQCP